MKIVSIFTFVFYYGVFYVLPFLLAVVLPAWGIPSLVRCILNRKREKLPSLLPFAVNMIFLAFLVNLCWEFLLFNKVYYEWDRTFLPYTFFSYESPILDGSVSWIAPGWKQWNLYVIWLTSTVFISVVSASLAYFLHRSSEHKKEYRKILAVSVVSLIVATLILPPFLGLLVKLAELYVFYNFMQ